ncbi:DNA-binding response regulator [Lacihabitans sp. LS3-19]|uniref:LytR/AlgR family response regulator transcription factor n=1 Tax=Lacihabitans sp. LS3-19 TaxID=2487335 RepID=UPI0020CD70CE|nr:LytTR family DNA-binding domain-containing protein [Lacihabitans sp. LS3-19]MCP9767478.1 DNA-binding response regulator [Lacihabitans sp. LS3-19]
MLNVIILDDESKAIQSLEWELKSFCPKVNVLATFTNPFEAKDYILNNPIDAIFLDIDMPQMDGFHFLEFFPSREFCVVITTAYDQYGIQALKQQAIDYLLKPIDSDDLIKSVEKIREKRSASNIKDMLEDMLLNINNSQTLGPKKVNISCDGKIYFLEPDEILYCESDGNYCNVFLENGQKLFLTQILKQIEEKLPKNLFYRVHNSYVVNLNKVREYQKNEGFLVLTNGKKVPVSRTKKSLFLEK